MTPLRHCVYIYINACICTIEATYTLMYETKSLLKHFICNSIKGCLLNALPTDHLVFWDQFHEDRLDEGFDAETSLIIQGEQSVRRWEAILWYYYNKIPQLSRSFMAKVKLMSRKILLERPNDKLLTNQFSGKNVYPSSKNLLFCKFKPL